jgi:hypothetical protein
VKTLDTIELDEADQRYVDRATAHVADYFALRRDQRFASYVSELYTARVMLAIERGTVVKRAKTGHWRAPAGSRLPHNLSVIINEMIRTGLLRDYRDPRTGQHTLIPAKTHLDDGYRTSLCLFTGEDLGPMRARLVKSMDLVDCLECEATYTANSIPRL